MATAAKKPVAAKKKPAKAPKWRSVPHKSTVGAAADDARSELTTLGEECREIVDNASEGLANTQRIQTLGETADTLEGLNEVDIPEKVQEVEVEWTEQVPYDKRRGPSRDTRCSNAVQCLQACAEALRTWAEDAPDEEAESEAHSTADELDEIAGEAESLEFPGMFG
jgi:hypothetical protein